MIHISREVHTVTQAPDWGLVFYVKTCYLCIRNKESIPKTIFIRYAWYSRPSVYRRAFLLVPTQKVVLWKTGPMAEKGWWQELPDIKRKKPGLLRNPGTLSLECVNPGPKPIGRVYLHWLIAKISILFETTIKKVCFDSFVFKQMRDKNEYPTDKKAPMLTHQDLRLNMNLNWKLLSFRSCQRQLPELLQERFHFDWYTAGTLAGCLVSFFCLKGCILLECLHLHLELYE